MEDGRVERWNVGKMEKWKRRNKRDKGKRWNSGILEEWKDGKTRVKYGIGFLLHYLELCGTLQQISSAMCCYTDKTS